ncbi:hypothetical protein K493DRAFT_47312 [Basidiobolus meristosporus CBS 931.73]|uniref:DUF4436 domain-containing protein n=1 Tax=Basidiobolus meristosporus CBS 931.73 TaxID=1314790 RepID=A0A1Y1Z3T8_9FUNG|nr:hypothetical protein K493DRAFT_47312 [Basidiobolus meristosporus CBS 931.73]|eukprot:ORY04922.1 hypothetical protein K493DRAFT_47312 [Basidiobolus meristosporus CBS 931.73]
MLGRGLRDRFPSFLLRRLVYAGVATILLCALVIPIFVVYIQKEPKYINTEYGSNNDTRLDIAITVVSIDTVNLRSQLSVDFDPRGNLVTGTRPKLRQAISVNFLYKVFTFPQNSSALLPSGDLTVPFLVGNRRNYPFDVYEASFLLYATSPGVVEDEIIPVSMAFDANIQNFETAPTFHVQDELNVITFRVKRSTNTKGFSICVIILMWALSLGISTLAFQIVFLKREIQPPIMALGVSMLFSLPALRNTQPGIPGIGCAADVISFFWNMFLVAISAIGFIWTYSVTWTRPQPEPPATPHTVESPTSSATRKVD